MDHPMIETATQTCFGCPDQWEGTLTSGEHFYFRYRWGWASLGLGDNPQAASHDPAEAAAQHGDSLQGVFDSDAERLAVFTTLLKDRLAG